MGTRASRALIHPAARALPLAALPGGNTPVGTPLQVWACGALGGANQRWSRTRAGQIRYGTTERSSGSTT
jgi:hypothetical protein